MQPDESHAPEVTFQNEGAMDSLRALRSASDATGEESGTRMKTEPSADRPLIGISSPESGEWKVSEETGPASAALPLLLATAAAMAGSGGKGVAMRLATATPDPRRPAASAPSPNDATAAPSS